MSSATTKIAGELPTASRPAASRLSCLLNRVYHKSSSLLNTVAKKYYDNNQYNFRRIIFTAFAVLTFISTIIFVLSQIRGISSKYCECSNLNQMQGRIIKGENVAQNELRWVAALLVRRKITKRLYRESVLRSNVLWSESFNRWLSICI